MVPDKLYQALAALGMESAEEGPSLGPEEAEMVAHQFKARIARLRQGAQELAEE